MNKRIRQLAEQATVYHNGGLGTEIESFDKEKFAELIVRECIDTAFHKGHPDLEFLLKHFGVK
jgi:hypothetical protein